MGVLCIVSSSLLSTPWTKAFASLPAFFPTWSPDSTPSRRWKLQTKAASGCLVQAYAVDRHPLCRIQAQGALSRKGIYFHSHAAQTSPLGWAWYASLFGCHLSIAYPKQIPWYSYFNLTILYSSPELHKAPALPRWLFRPKLLEPLWIPPFFHNPCLIHQPSHYIHPQNIQPLPTVMCLELIAKYSCNFWAGC